MISKEAYESIGVSGDEKILILNKYFEQFQFSIDDILCFLPNLAHESLGLAILVENLNYSEDGLLRVFKKYFNTANVKQYARKPEKIANKVYANRGGNGNEQSGDGWKYRGRGGFQLTLKRNYEGFTKWANDNNYSKEDFVKNPEKVQEIEYAILSSFYYWEINQLSKYAEKEDFQSVCSLINTGRPDMPKNAINGWNDRFNKYIILKEKLKSK